MFFLSIALALGATSSAVLPVVNVDQTNVDLSGAGAVNFEGEGNKVVALLPKQLAIDLHGRIKFGHDGVPLSCQSEAEVASKEAGDELCRQMMKSAHFNLMPGFDLPFSQGELAFVARFSETERPMFPIRFLAPGSGKSYFIKVISVRGKETCSLQAPLFPQRDARAVCDAWMNEGKPGLEGQQAQIWLPLAQGPGTQKPGFSISISDKMLWKNREIRYSASRPAPDTYLTDEDGQLRLAVSGYDYPPRALRENIGGSVTLLLGFDRTGRPVTCRPIESSGTAYLDNSTCWTAMRRSRFEFTPNSPQFDGIRYQESRTVWRLPSD